MAKINFRFVWLKVSRAFLVMAPVAILAIGCSPAHEGGKITIQLPVATSFVAESSSNAKASDAKSLNGISLNKWAMNDPSSMGQVTCYAVAVEIPETGPALNCSKLDGTSVIKPTLFFGTYPAGKSIEIDIPSGTKRVIHLIGFAASSLAACETLDTSAGPKPAKFSAPFLLASQQVDLSPGPNAVTLTAELKATGKFNDCGWSNVNAAPTPVPSPGASPTPIPGAVLEISEDGLGDYGSVAVGATADRILTFKNTGLKPATSVFAALSPSSGFNWVGSVFPGTGGTCGATVAVASTCTVAVRFTPVTGANYSSSMPVTYSGAASGLGATTYAIKGIGLPAATAVWNFDLAGDMVGVQTGVEVQSGLLHLAPIALGDFGVGTLTNTIFSSASLKLSSSGLTAGSGSYESPVFDGGSTSMNWSSFHPNAAHPYGKELNPIDTTTYPGGTLNLSGLAGLWHFNEVTWAGVTNEVVDSSTLNHHGVAKGASGLYPALGADVARFSTVASFNGTSHYVSLPAVDNTVSSAQNYSISIWAKTSTSGTDQYMIGTTQGSTGFAIIRLSTGAIRAQGYTTGGTLNMLTSTSAPTSGVWHHYVFTWVGGVAMTLYIDGAPNASAGVGTYPALPSSTGVTVGAAPGGASGYWNGSLDDVAVFSRVLSSAEVALVYIRGAAQVGYQVRTCSVSDCSDSNYVGPLNNQSLYFYDDAPSAPAFAVPNPTKRYFQYRVSFKASSTISPVLYGVKDLYYRTNSPYGLISGPTYVQLDSFNETLGVANQGILGYQLSPDGGTTWWYFSGSHWVTTNDATLKNSASVVNAHISTFATDAGKGTLWVRVFLTSSGQTSAELDQLSIGYH